MSAAAAAAAPHGSEPGAVAAHEAGAGAQRRRSAQLQGKVAAAAQGIKGPGDVQPTPAAAAQPPKTWAGQRRPAAKPAPAQPQPSSLVASSPSVAGPPAGPALPTSRQLALGSIGVDVELTAAFSQVKCVCVGVSLLWGGGRVSGASSDALLAQRVQHEPLDIMRHCKESPAVSTTCYTALLPRPAVPPAPACACR